MNQFRRSKSKEKRENDSIKLGRAKLGIIALVCVLVLSITVVAQPISPFLTPDPANHSANDSINESTVEAPPTDTDANESSPTADVNESTSPSEGVNVSENDDNVTEFNRTVIIPWRPKGGSWYFKSNYSNYAPSGMPDFNQTQDNWVNPAGLWSFCGPTAVANCFWWFDSKYADSSGFPGDGLDDFPLVRDYNESTPLNPGPSTDDHAFDNVDDINTPWPMGVPPALPPFPGVPAQGAELVERLAWCMDTDGSRTGSSHSGTNVFEMQVCIDNWITAAGLGNLLYEHTVKMPTFEYIEEEIKRSQDVILLLGFWEWQPYPEPARWVRIGGHYVTCAGVDSLNRSIAFSDPFFDNAEAGGQGRILPGPHGYPHGPTVHNDALFVSHDYYLVTPGSPSPGGIEYLDEYPVTLEPPLVNNFEYLNVPPEFEQYQGVWHYGPIHTEIEYAVTISPKCIEVNKTVWNGTAWVKDMAANINDTLRFRLWVHNTGACDCNLANIAVTDNMSCSLNYSGDATIEPDVTYYPCNNTTLTWNFPGLVLEPCQNITIEFNATVVKCPGVDTNILNATAWCNEMIVSDEDIVTVAVMPTPFKIYGWVTGTTGQPLNGPNVVVKNLNTTEEYAVETNASESYYHVITSSCNVSAGDMIYFNASDNGNSTNCTVTVTLKNMTDGGLFDQNLSLQQGICGDVDNDGYVTGGDATKVWDVACHVSPPSILDNPWAADVDCDGFITGGDATKIWDVACHVSPASILNCCP